MRYIILLFALTLSMAKASAQDVLNEVLRTSDAIINDTTKSMDERRTALFKFDAMTYMRSKILPPYVMLDKNLSKGHLEHQGSLSQRAGLRHERLYYALSEATEGGFKQEQAARNPVFQAGNHRSQGI